MAAPNRDSVSIRDRPDWMTRDDYWLLEYLADPDEVTVLSPAILAFNLDMSPDHVNRRLSVFVDHGVAEKVDRGKYEITDRGRAYLAGDLDADELEREE